MCQVAYMLGTPCMTSKKRELTVKEQRLIKGIVEGKPKYKAAEAAGYSPKSAAVIATETLKKPNVQEALQAAFEEHGITVSKVIKPIADGLQAEKVHIVGNGDAAMAEVVPDHSIRLKASSMALGLMVPKSEGTTVNINFNKVVEDDRTAFGI